MSYAGVERAAVEAGLIVMGAFHPRGDQGPEGGGGTLFILGTGPGFWPLFRGSGAHSDGRADPLDRWSKRVIGAMAATFGATCSFPSDGPPYPPFIAWSVQTGRFFSSPVGMLVHDQAGLMVSMRGSLQFDEVLPLPAQAVATPCDSCVDRACLDACPVGALGGETGYDVAACHRFLDTAAGAECMSQGCRARRACPVSRRFGRDPEQSAFHMRAFHP